ncbi:3-hydroxyacyl-CoA dehydrogenase NAD-binding domain-containing protein [Epibacterium sp. Ofav1-8]|uniref:3-hydroxyacyl-CoA dehydrogenase NAD-binding domain-containing protein n=1 Tax=Epibacterium sp. Ofav1-8 TaxID=2917735 RepID=UPI001EF43313|nr:3-hydroxyacyl-CoA dehydrogenase NAD-binding domain-containing protein [Epibacterium sp. Ofav1-8]MCG7625148.1 3-hydroxyacyl-CoA dehydrogenase NAD-binding domain-containing protein [Epibacterium sp. Ofav1-8]
MAFSVETRQDIAVVRMDDGGMNLLSRHFNAQLISALEQAAQTTCKAIVLTGNARAFCAGADVSVLDDAVLNLDPNLQYAVADAIARLNRPLVALIETCAIGGGLELAMMCHYRVATASAKVGLPEVTLGVLPGAGGTQLLPRAIGLELALNAMLSGRVMCADKMPAGLFDKLTGDDDADNDALGTAIAFAIGIADRRPLPRLQDRKVDHPNAAGFLEFARTGAARDPRRLPGLLPLIDAVECAVTEPYARGLEKEMRAFEHLRSDPRARALRYAFQAEGKAARVPGLPRQDDLPGIATAAVIGAGAMGTGIAIAMVEAGLTVKLHDLDPAASAAAVTRAQGTWDIAQQKGRLSEYKAQDHAARLVTADAHTDLADCDLVIEAVAENMDVKRAVFAALDAVMKPGAILASNTSSLDLDEIAACTTRPGDVIGLHFFNPANIMRLVEVVRGRVTSDRTLSAALDFAKRLRKIPVVSGVCDGFIGNRMIESYVRQAQSLIEEGATPASVDRALERFGMAMGPFRMQDLAGNDIIAATRDRRRDAHPDLKFPAIADKVSGRGWFGQKTGKGWYDHVPGARKLRENADLLALLEAHSAEIGRERRKISDVEITERCLFALVNEGAAILAEGIASRASDIDVVYLNGYGFPRHLGGPMHFAEQFGLSRLVRRMAEFAALPQADPGVWVPHPLLQQAADQLIGWHDLENVK